MKVYLTKILLWKFTMALVFMFWKCSHMYICIFWHNFAGDMGMFSKRTAGGWVDYDRGSRPRRAELLWCRKGDIFCKISWIWIAKFPICVWSWRCNKLFWFKGTQKSWMHDGSAITEKFQAIWASASGARNWLLGGNYWVQDLEGFPRVCIGTLWQKSSGFKCSTRNSANGSGRMPAEAMGWQVENCNRSAKYWILHKNCRALWLS